MLCYCRPYCIKWASTPAIAAFSVRRTLLEASKPAQSLASLSRCCCITDMEPDSSDSLRAACRLVLERAEICRTPAAKQRDENRMGHQARQAVQICRQYSGTWV
jgi:hypothetical protein